MSRTRIAVLYDVWWPVELPPPPSLRVTEPPPEEEGGAPVEPPEVHEEVYETLRELGFLPAYVVLDGEVGSLVRLARSRASLYFNLTESYAGDDTKDLHIAALLELLGKAYTGNGPRALHLGQDKALAKKILRYHGIPTPCFATVSRGAHPRLGELPWPLIVKPSREDGSIGIDSGSVVYDERSLAERLDYVNETFSGDALVEGYVKGRDIYVGVVGSDPPEALPLVEVDFSALPEGVPRIAGTEVKWWKGTEIYRNTPPVFPEDLSRDLTERIQEIALAAYRALGLRDYGRVDLRLGEDGKAYVLEVNPNPWLVSSCEFVMAWKKTGRSYPELIDRIVRYGLARRANLPRST